MTTNYNLVFPNYFLSYGHLYVFCERYYIFKKYIKFSYDISNNMKKQFFYEIIDKLITRDVKG